MTTRTSVGSSLPAPVRSVGDARIGDLYSAHLPPRQDDGFNVLWLLTNFHPDSDRNTFNGVVAQLVPLVDFPLLSRHDIHVQVADCINSAMVALPTQHEWVNVGECLTFDSRKTTRISFLPEHRTNVVRNVLARLARGDYVPSDISEPWRVLAQAEENPDYREMLAAVQSQGNLLCSR